MFLGVGFDFGVGFGAVAALWFLGCISGIDLLLLSWMCGFIILWDGESVLVLFLEVVFSG